MSAPIVLLLGVEKDTALGIESDCVQNELAVEYTYPTTAKPALCVARADFGQELFELRAQFPNCLLAVFGETPNHDYPDDAIWLRQPIRSAALMALIEMIAAPNPFDEAELEELREIFWQRYQHDLSMFEAWLQRGEFAQIKRIGHQLAGTAATLGYPKLGLLGRRLEDAVTNTNLTYLQTAFAELARYIRE